MMNTEFFNRLHAVELEELSDFMREVLGINGLEDAEQLSSPEVQEKFKISDPLQLSWAMRKMDAFKASKQQTEALYNVEKERIDAWKKRELNKVEQSTKFFEYLISEYMNEKRKENAKFKSESTPYGRATFTVQQPEWIYRDETAAAKYILAMDEETDLVKVETTIANKTNAKKALTIVRNVFIANENEEDEAAADRYMVVSYGTVDDETGEVKSMEYILRDGVIYSTDTGEIAEGIEYRKTAALMHGYVIPGIEVEDRADRIDIKPGK